MTEPLIDFEDVKSRAMRKSEVRTSFTRERAVRIAAETVQRVRTPKKISQSNITAAVGKPQSLASPTSKAP